MEEIQLDTRVKDLTHQLEATLHDLEELQHAISHDLKAPIRAISGFCTILQEDYSDKLDAEANRLIEVIVSNSFKMSHLIDDIIRISRIGKKHLSLQIVPMQLFAEQCLNDLVLPIEREEFEITIGDLPDCWGDASLLKEAWLQLMKHTLKQCLKKKHLRLEISSFADEATQTYAVKDLSSGQNPENSRLLSLKQRLSSIDNFESTETSMALVKRIMLKHNGSLWIEALDDNGTAFYFSIPRLNM